MRTTTERLPDGSAWVAIKHGPILLGAPCGTNALLGLFADDSRMGHVAHGPTVPLDQAPVLLAAAEEVPRYVQPDLAAGPLRFRLSQMVEPAAPAGIPLMPFFRLHEQRYQIYWQLMTPQELAARRERLAAEERAKARRDALTLDRVAAGEQQPEVEHDFAGERTETGLRNGWRYRRGEWFQYSLALKGEKAAELLVVYVSGDRGRSFDILVNGEALATETLNTPRPGEFIEKRYALPAQALAGAADGRLTIKFQAKPGSAVGAVHEVRLMKPETP
jgi:hypothetical protein